MTRAGWTQAEREWSRRPERVDGREMAWGRWLRWRRGSCEGFGLEIGHLLRFSIVADAGRTIWRLSLNAREIGAYPDFESAIAAAEAEARAKMTLALQFWTRSQAEPNAAGALAETGGDDGGLEPRKHAC
jgi:hypothetical protein